MRPLTVAAIVAEIDRRVGELTSQVLGSVCAAERRDELRVVRGWIVRGGKTASDARDDS